MAGSSALRCPSNPVSTSRPPTSSAAVTTSEWATRQATVPSGSMAKVSISAWTRTWARRDDAEQGDERRRGPVVPARPRRSRSRDRTCGTRRRRRAGRPYPSGSRAARRGSSEANRAVQAPRGPSSRSSARHSGSGSAATRRAQVDQVAAGLGQREDRRPGAAPAPPPAGPQAAGVGDGGVARLGRRRDAAAASGAGVLGRRRPAVRVPADRCRDRQRPPRDPPRGRSSAIGATVALDRIRRVPGGTGKTAVGQAGRRPDDRVPPEIRVHDHPDRSSVADRWDAADREAGQLARLAGRRPPDVRGRRSPPPAGRGRPGWARRPGTAAARGHRPSGTTKTSDLTIWPSSAPTAAAASTAVWVDSSKTVTSSVTPLRAAASSDALDRWVERGVGHGPESSIGSRG